MKVIYEEGKDLGLENWRISAKLENHRFMYPDANKANIIVKIENFDYGFVESSDSWDKLFYRKDDSKRYYIAYVSVISKNMSKLDSYLEPIILKLKEIIEYNIKEHQKECQESIKYHEKSIELYKEVLNSDLYKNINRDSKLDSILNQK